MEEIRFHGRGGQGAVIGSEVLAQAFFLEGNYVQAFPAFGVERRGAPVTAFLRMDSQPILLRSQIYKPGHVVVLDASLLETVAVTQGLHPGGTVLINGALPFAHYRKRIVADYRVFVVDASGIAVRHRLGGAANPIVNTAILGAFAQATGLVGLTAVERAIEEKVPVKQDANVRAAREAFDSVEGDAVIEVRS